MRTKILNYLLKILDPISAEKMIKSLKSSPPLCLRTNTLKISPDELKTRLENIGFKLNEIELVPGAFIVLEEPVPISKTIEHFAGLFYIQSLSSMLPAIALSPQPGEYILDIASAPGSKATHIAQLMKNSGVIFANDVIPDRLKVLVHNIERLGVLNTAVTSIDGNRFGNILPEIFDRVLVDVPCSALGIISKANEVLNWWSENEVRRFSNKQKQLLTSAIKAAKPNGIIVYSTCTLTVEENELVIEDALKKFPIEIEEISFKNIDFDEGITFYNEVQLDERLKKTIRIYPFKFNSEGFFIAKIRKTDITVTRTTALNDFKILSSQKGTTDKFKLLTYKNQEIRSVLNFLSNRFGIDESVWEKFAFHIKADEIWFSSIDFINFFSNDDSTINRNLKTHLLNQIIQRLGIKLAKHVKKERWKISTSALQLLAPYVNKNVIDLENENDVKVFLNGGILKNYNGNFELGEYIAVRFSGIMLGCGLVTKAGIKSQIPRGRRTIEIEIS